MFTIYHSNQLDVLKSIIATLIERDPLQDPFAHEVILVQSPGMAQWLQMELAQHLDIAANIDFPLPATYIWKIIATILPDIPQESSFRKDLMVWKLMLLLPELLADHSFAALRHYLEHDNRLSGKRGRDNQRDSQFSDILPATAKIAANLSDEIRQRKLYQLAARIADLFDQYLVYRPQWLASWQQRKLIEGLGEAQQWQAQLWYALQDYTRQRGEPLWHRANLYQHVISLLQKKEAVFPGLPPRLFICGISALPPAYLHTLQALGHHCDIHLMVSNPCRYYWGDLVKQQGQYQQGLIKGGLVKEDITEQDLTLEANDQNNREQTHAHDQIHTHNMGNGHPLLASWGKLGRDNLYLLTQLADSIEIDAFVEGSRETLLQRLQDDILQLQDRSVVGKMAEGKKSALGKQRLELQDRSLTFHSCYSAQREVEVLHDQLLTLFAEENTLMPRDVIVMVADIDSYTPYIEAVFANAPAERYLPFAISDRHLSEAHPILQGFITLLMLPESRFNAEEILSLLEIPILAAHFAIDEAELRQLREWVKESGIRWGLDSASAQALELPVTGQHTWRFGLNRMLLGYAMASESGIWQGILPYDGCRGLEAVLAGKLAELLQQLAYWRQQLEQPKTLAEWQPLCQQLLACFFQGDNSANNSDEVSLVLIEQQWQQLIEDGLTAGYPHKTPLVILRDELITRLEQQRVSQRFLAGPINFCTLMPMRSIPFRVICLLGMNDGAYPRTLYPPGFDLMADNVQKGDRSRRDDDRYLFLEALLSAQQRLYLSYIGRSVQDNRQRYPSVLVTELLEYIEQSHYLPGDEDLDSDSSAHRVRQHLLVNHTRVPFSPENYLQGSQQQSFAAEWLPAAAGHGKATPSFADRLLPAVELIALPLEQLYNFYRHPVRFFFQQRLNVFFSQEERELEDEEPFFLEGLSRYLCRQELLQNLIEGKAGAQVWQRQQAAGVLPYGAFSRISWQQLEAQVQPLAEQICQQRQAEENLEVELEINGIRLYGWINRVQADGLLRWRAAKLSIKDGIQLWLEHLLYSAMGGKGESRIYGIENNAWHFPALSRQEAQHWLTHLLQGHQRGLCQPLFLLPESGWAWLIHCYDQQSGSLIWHDDEVQGRAQQALLKAWQGRELWGKQAPAMRGEGEDPYFYRLLPALDEQGIEKIMAEAQNYLLPLRKMMIQQTSGN